METSNFVEMDTNEFVAVFVNEKREITKNITPLGIYSHVGGTILELCNYEYLFEETVRYTILKWEDREPKDAYSKALMIRLIDEQKSFVNLIK